MVTLAFDTSAAHCTAAVLSAGGEVLAHRFEQMEKGQAERLMTLCEDALAEANMGWKDVTLIGVGTGPGNFTGIRIAVSAARGLAISLGVKAVGVSALESLAHGSDMPCLATLDARQGKLYAQVFDEGLSADTHLCDIDHLPEPGADSKPTCIGYLSEDVAQRCGGQAQDAAFPIAIAIAQIAKTRRDTNTLRPAPHYVRAPDAAPPRDKPPKILDA